MYVEFWDVLGVNVMRTFEEFHKKAVLYQYFNTFFIALIPKKKEAIDLRDFQLISFLNRFYKLLAKVLTKRVEEVMGLIISPLQNAFVKGC